LPASVLRVWANMPLVITRRAEAKAILNIMGSFL
jgi:hypothetical protein